MQEQSDDRCYLCCSSSVLSGASEDLSSITSLVMGYAPRNDFHRKMTRRCFCFTCAEKLKMMHRFAKNFQQIICCFTSTFKYIPLHHSDYVVTPSFACMKDFRICMIIKVKSKISNNSNRWRQKPGTVAPAVEASHNSEIYCSRIQEVKCNISDLNLLEDFRTNLSAPRLRQHLSKLFISTSSKNDHLYCNSTKSDPLENKCIVNQKIQQLITLDGVDTLKLSELDYVTNTSCSRTISHNLPVVTTLCDRQDFPNSNVKIPYSCSICHKSFTTQMYLHRHLSNHNGRKLRVCPICCKTFTYNCNLKRHILIHTGVKPYMCSKCQTSFSQKQQLDNHMMVHTGIKPYTCVMCYKSFRLKTVLKQHMYTHTNEKLYSCWKCEKSFTSELYLKKHLSSHGSRKLFSCSVCDKTFTFRCNLRRHFLIHTGEKPFACGHCNMSFTQKIQLDKHTSLYCGKKPYSCLMCHRSFNTRTVLNHHMSIHTASKQLYSCPICSKSFSYNCNLKRHLLVHTNDKPYRCLICEAKFSQKHQLGNHISMHVSWSM